MSEKKKGKTTIATGERGSAMVEVYKCGACDDLHLEFGLVMGNGIVRLNMDPHDAIDLAVSIMSVAQKAMVDHD